MSTAARMTKAAIKKLQVAERKSMREKQKNSRMMQRSLSIYRAMDKRAVDERGHGLCFPLSEFRMWFSDKVAGLCEYCGEPLTVNSLTPDHYDSISNGGSFDKGNLVASCKPCNWQKGALSGDVFAQLVAWIRENCDAKQAADIKRRLTIGGKWSFSK